MRILVAAGFLSISAACSTAALPDGSIADASIADASLADASITDASIADADQSCSAATCPQGCCDSSGHCMSATHRACGSAGASCVDCIASGATCSPATNTCVTYDGGCFVEPVPGSAWETGSCPDAGCPSGTFCLRGVGESGSDFGCAPLPAACDGGLPTCACMGCVCGIDCHDSDAGASCDNGTISRRSLKRDVTYLTDAERTELAKQTLQIPLARYRYWNEPETSRRRLGFLIEDQPNPSFAVLEDRQHVDEYGYTSLLLATLQAQAKEIAALRERIEKLERAQRR